MLHTCNAGVSLVSLSPTADVAGADPFRDDWESGEELDVPGGSDRQAWKSRTKLAKDDLYIGLSACRGQQTAVPVRGSSSLVFVIRLSRVVRQRGKGVDRPNPPLFLAIQVLNFRHSLQSPGRMTKRQCSVNVERGASRNGAIVSHHGLHHESPSPIFSVWQPAFPEDIPQTVDIIV